MAPDADDHTGSPELSDPDGTADPNRGSPSGRPPAPRRFNLIRSFAAADFITLGNAACGTAAMFMCLSYLDSGDRDDLWIAFALLPVALIMDVLDGFVARWRHRHSPFGADLDSLADVVSFGVAPAVLGYTLGMRGVPDIVLLVYFVCCGIGRLARFNVTQQSLADDSGKVRYYEGTPIPTSLLIVAVLAVATATDRIGPELYLGELPVLGATFHPLTLLYALNGSAMISDRLRIPKP